MTIGHVWLLIGLAVLALVPRVPAQQRDPAAKPIEKRVGTAIVAGSVMSSETGDTPVRRAIVTLISTERVESVSAVTDNEGRFAFTDLSDGRYTLNARKAAHLSVNYGAKRTGRPRALTLQILAAEPKLFRPIFDPRSCCRAGAVITRASTARPINSHTWPMVIVPHRSCEGSV